MNIFGHWDDMGRLPMIKSPLKLEYLAKKGRSDPRPMMSVIPAE